MAEVAVVILNWNGVHFLEKFLPPLVEFTDRDIADIWIADNGSTDSSLELLKKKFPSVKIIELLENYGFADGYNRALEQIDSPYIVLLNSDVEVTSNWLVPLYHAMKNDASLGACMPKIKSWYNRDSFEHAGAAGGFIDKFGYPFCRGRIFNRIEKDKGQFNNDLNIFWASGACLIVRSELYKRSGGLDPFFFAHMEEIDLCWRINNTGNKIIYIPSSVIYHIGGGTLSYDSSRKLFFNFRNNLFLLYKNLPGDRLHKILFKRMLLDSIAAIRFLLTFKIIAFISVFEAHIDYYRHKKALRKKREDIQQYRITYPDKLILNKSLVYDFFIRKKETYSELLKD